MRVVFAGTPEPALPALEAIAASRHELVGVVTRPDAPAGRGRRLDSSPSAPGPRSSASPCSSPTHPRDPEFQEALRDLAPDCCPVVAYGALLPQSALDIPVHGWVNLHFSVLPAWRGAAPVQHALWAGDEVTGATTFRIVRELDAGPTYGLMTERVRPGDTAGDAARAAGRGRRRAAGGHPRRHRGRLDRGPRRSPRTASASPPRSPSRTRTSTGPSPRWRVDRRIRACTPAPGAWTTWQGERVKLGPVTPADGALPPGELLVGKNAVAVGTGTGALKLGLVKAFGKKEMPAADWARGVRVEPGARFE